MKNFLTIEQAAQYLGLSYHTLNLWRKTGKGPEYIKLPTGRVRYEVNALDAWAKGGA